MRLGFRVHTGWAATVAVGGVYPEIKIVARHRVELLVAGGPIPRFVFHAASEGKPAKAREAVRLAREMARERATEALGRIVAEMDSNGCRVVACGVPMGATKIPASLDGILASHALIHAAEGDLFRRALMDAAEDCGLAVTKVLERDAWQAAATELGATAEDVRMTIDALGKTLGPPWGEDQKVAAAAALACAWDEA